METPRMYLGQGTSARSYLYRGLAGLNYLVSIPFAIGFLLCSSKIQPAYRMTAWKKWLLGLRLLRNQHLIRPSGTSFKAVLAMALKILEFPKDQAGVVVECGTWKGGSAASLSLVCRIVERDLYIFDSFEGLPQPATDDFEGRNYNRGDFRGTLEEVKRNIVRYGALERCHFVQGWFADTLPKFKERVLLAYIDVDLELSLEIASPNSGLAS